ncbi:MAG: hypothetical protein KBS56_02920 [Clostridiales bacterium]|nr:hypothetical protein [Candidatus Crickella equi]
MARSIFTEDQVNALRSNQYVESVTSRRITYTLEFKKKFVEEYRLGKGPRQIFKDAGFDVDALGYKRIERASDRWRADNNNGRLGDKIDYIEVHRERQRHKLTLRQQLEQQEDQIFKLQLENLELRNKLARLQEA